MDKIKLYKWQLKQIIDANVNLPVDGIVTAIENDTCSVQFDDGFEVSDVRLKASADGADNLLIIPKVGSRVLMISTDGTVANLTVIKCDQASKIIFKENGLEVVFDGTDGKVMIKNNSTSLKDLFQRSAEIKKNMKVSTPMGPSGTPLPDVLLLIEQFENKFKALLK